MTNQCKHAKQDNKGYTNCLKSDSTIGLCQQPCPYKLHHPLQNENVTHPLKRQRKAAFAKRSCCLAAFTPQFNVLHFELEAVGVEFYA